MIIWKDVVGFEGIYQVSNEGQVRSFHSGAWKLVRSNLNRLGYVHLNLCKNGKKFKKLVHQLVLESFIGPRPSDKHVSCHKNGNRSDNRAENLRWGTYKSNAADKREHRTEVVGSDKPAAKLCEDTVLLIRERLSQGERQCLIAKEFKVCPATISHIKNRRKWTHI